MQQLTRATSISHGVTSQFHDRLSDFLRSRRCGQRLPERYRHGIGNALRPLPKEPAVLEAEDATPQPVQVHRNDGDVQSLHDLFEPALELEQMPRAADRPFSEDADDMALLQILTCPFQGLADFPAVP